MGDADLDGWPDLAVTSSNGPAELLVNRTDASANRLVVRLRGRRANRDALGARVWLTPLNESAVADAAHEQMYELSSSGSYLSQNAAEIYAGLGAAGAARITVRWPGGEMERIEAAAAGQILLIVEGRGIVARRPLNDRSPDSGR